MFKMIILQQSASQKLEGKKVVRQLFLTYLIQMFSQSRVNTRILILLLSSQLVLLAKLTNYIKTCCTNPNIFLHLMHTFFKQLSIFLCLCQAVLRIRIFRIRMVSLDPYPYQKSGMIRNRYLNQILLIWIQKKPLKTVNKFSFFNLI